MKKHHQYRNPQFVSSTSVGNLPGDALPCLFIDAQHISSGDPSWFIKTLNALPDGLSATFLFDLDYKCHSRFEVFEQICAYFENALQTCPSILKRLTPVAQAVLMHYVMDSTDIVINGEFWGQGKYQGPRWEALVAATGFDPELLNLADMNS